MFWPVGLKVGQSFARGSARGQEILPHYCSTELEIRLIYPSRKHLPRKGARRSTFW
jgi:hypothetical protein